MFGMFYVLFSCSVICDLLGGLQVSALFAPFKVCVIIGF